MTPIHCIHFWRGPVLWRENGVDLEMCNPCFLSIMDMVRRAEKIGELNYQDRIDDTDHDGHGSS